MTWFDCEDRNLWVDVFGRANYISVCCKLECSNILASFRSLISCLTGCLPPVFIIFPIIVLQVNFLEIGPLSGLHQDFIRREVLMRQVNGTQNCELDYWCVALLFRSYSIEQNNISSAATF